MRAITSFGFFCFVSIYANYIVLYHVIMCEFINYCEISWVLQFKLSGGAVLCCATSGCGGMADAQHSCSGMHMHPVETHPGVISPFWVGLTKHSPIPFKDFFFRLPPTPIPNTVCVLFFKWTYNLTCHVMDIPRQELLWKIHSGRALKTVLKYLWPKMQDACRQKAKIRIR